MRPIPTPTLLTPPAVEPVSLAAAKAHLRISHAEEDAAIVGLIAAGRRIVEARTGLCLMHARWSLGFNRWPGDGILPLAPDPVAEVEELAVLGEEEQRAVIDPAHYYLEPAPRSARLVLRGGRNWPRPGRATGGIAIKLRAGFGPAPEDVPEPLRQAVLLLVAQYYACRGEEAGPREPAGLDLLLAPYRAVRL